MTLLLLLLAAVALTTGLLFVGHVRAALLAGPALFLFGAWPTTDWGGSTSWWVLVALFALLALLLATPLRRWLLGPPLVRVMAGIFPRMSDTERIALEAGTVWWDAQLFSGKPDWRTLLDFRPRPLSEKEQAFLDGPVQELCSMVDEWDVQQRGDLPPEVWRFVKEKRFMGIIIPEEFGGLGFSARANSAIVTKISGRSVTAAVTVMVPNSLGPAELLLHYGTDEQKRHWLPRLAVGEEVPCFALTEPLAGSDAGSMRSEGVVCRGTWEGAEVLGMRLTWDKRYITLSAIATVLGLAFKLRDPDGLLGGEEDLGITCALIPVSTPGVETGERHDPLGIPFVNGPTHGEDVFVPLDFIIGGPPMAGQGWRMLMDCLSAGRAISLPALSVGASQLTARVAGAHATVREQFGLPLGRFEGIQEPLGRIAGTTWLFNAARLLTAGAVDAGEKPAVIGAILKAWSTEGMRRVVNDGMDVLGGGGICLGPRNTLGHAYRALPIGITVEGANILTRTMITFGQGAIRCHPFAFAEMEAARAKDAARFDAAFFGHLGFVARNKVRAWLLGLTDGRLASVPVTGEVGRGLQRLERLSAAFAFLADVAMGTLGGQLKFKEMLSGRLADALAWLYLGSAAAHRYFEQGLREVDRPFFRWAMAECQYRAQEALRGVCENMPARFVGGAAKLVVFPLGARLRPPSDRLTSQAARSLLDGHEGRVHLTRDIYVPLSEQHGLAQLERALAVHVEAQPARDKVKAAVKAKTLPRLPEHELVDPAFEKGVLDASERDLLREAAAARLAAVQVDSFDHDTFLGLSR